MTATALSLFDAENALDAVAEAKAAVAEVRSTVAEVRSRVASAIAQVDANADTEWKAAALDIIRWTPEGRVFLAQAVTATLALQGHGTHDNRAMGPVIRRAKSLGLIESAGYAHDGFGSPKSEWRRVNKGEK